MIRLEDIKEAAQSTVNEQGKPVVQIPRELWDEWLAQQPKSIQELRPENQQALALLDEWEANPDDTPDEWWDQFQQFLKDNRFDLSR